MCLTGLEFQLEVLAHFLEVIRKQTNQLSVQENMLTLVVEIRNFDGFALSH